MATISNRNSFDGVFDRCLPFGTGVQPAAFATTAIVGDDAISGLSVRRGNGGNGDNGGNGGNAAGRSALARVTLFGLRLTNVSMDGALALIDQALAAGTPKRIAFVNADCVNIAARNDAYRRDLGQMDHVFIDGIGMKIAGHVLGQPIVDNVNGTDLFPRLCASLAAQGRSVFLYGARPGTAERAANWAAQRHPGLVIAGTEHGYQPESEHPALLQRIRDSRADVLLVAQGVPRQEAWITRHADAAGAMVTMGVGGLFDYYAGNVRRAPQWMRKTGLEWIFRLIQEPVRLARRYLIGNGVFLARVLREKLR